MQFLYGLLTCKCLVNLVHYIVDKLQHLVILNGLKDAAMTSTARARISLAGLIGIPPND